MTIYELCVCVASASWPSFNFVIEVVGVLVRSVLDLRRIFKEK